MGVTAFASDADGTTNDVTYSLSSNPGNAFSIDADTGEVTVNDPSQLDFENAQSMQIEVTATSEDGSTSSEAFNIAINDVDEFDVSAVTDSDTTTNAVSESASVGASVGVTAFASDADGTTNDVTYSLSSNPGNAFSIDADTGEVTVNDPSQLDFETATSMQIEVTATSQDGSVNQATFAISVDDVNEGANVAVNNASGDEDTAIALNIELSDVEAGATVSVTIADVPTGATLSAGTDNGDGSWTLEQSDLSGLTIMSAPNSDEDFTLSVTTDVSESGNTVSYNNSIEVTVDAVADAPALSVINASAMQEVFESTFEVGVGDGSTLFVSDADGWVAGSEAIEIRNENQHTGDAADGDQFIELNSSTYYDDASIVQRTVSTEEDTPYELNFQVSPRPGAEQYSDFIVQAVDVDTGVVLKTMEVNWDGNAVNELTWEQHSFQFVGNGGDVRLVFQDSGQVNTYGRGALIDDIQFSESSGVNGAEPIDMSSLIAIGAVDNDGSETITLDFNGLPDAATLASASGEIDIEDGVANISLDDLASLQLTMPSGFTGNLNIEVTANSTEQTGGDTASSTETLSINIVSNDENLDSSGLSSDDNLSGTSSDDVLYGGEGDDTVSAGDGNDILYGGSGDDVLNGQDGNDMLMGGDGDDTLNGGDGNDFLQGGTGNDTLDGGAGDDVIYAGVGDDSLLGGDGNDIFIFEQGNGSDSIDGGAGNSWTDSIDLSDIAANAADSSSPWTIEVDGQAVDYDINAELLELGTDVSGVIQFDDGSQISFDNIENIEW